MEIPIKIRGIYATALTKIFKDNQFHIILPTEKIRERLNLQESDQKLYWDFITIYDRRDKQGIIIEGEKEKVDKVINVLRDELFDIIIRKLQNPKKNDRKTGSFLVKDSVNLVTKEVEFPYYSKFKLDSIRDSVTPTIRHHHKYRIIFSDLVDNLEKDLKEIIDKRKAEEKLNKIVYKEYRYGTELKLHHVKIDGGVINISGGKIINFNIKDKALVLKRELKAGGVYDGLRVPIEEGDYSITELKEGAYLIVHSYYSKDKELKGRYYNINTGCEFYPDYIRYIDLEIDVIKFPDGKKKIIDSKLLDEKMNNGLIKEELVNKAKEIAQKI